ncbi:MAG: 50S ribosomal protein L3 [Myxococcota bacterium]|nr:50S ribosomal protein L3 [Myxococcota bacterium]MDW8360790.1 50S ribosomal protein L3 [Myxococcales bacterium]
MNTNVGLIGKKLGCTQIFADDGTVLRVTVIEAGPCVVLGKRTPERDGYSALQIGWGRKRDKAVRKPEKGFFDKIGVQPVAVVRELRVPPEVAARYQVGQSIAVSDVFRVGQKVDVQGRTKGRGFTGVVKRWNFKGSRTSTHGTHEYQRHGGAIGTRLTPGRTFPGMRMAGRYGNEKLTVLSLRLVKIVESENLLLVEGGVPGPNEGIVLVRPGVKDVAPAAAAS